MSKCESNLCCVKEVYAASNGCFEHLAQAVLHGRSTAKCVFPVML